MQSKHKHITFIISLFAIITFFSSCAIHKKGDHEVPDETKHSFEGYEKATVINYSVDGCTWMLLLDDGRKLQPAELKTEFQKDKLMVWITYTIKKGSVGICMTGTMISLTDIQLRK